MNDNQQPQEEQVVQPVQQTQSVQQTQPVQPQPAQQNNPSALNEVDAGKAMAIIAYLGILALIPFLAEKNNKYVVFHAKQGMNLLILEVIAGVAVGIVCAILNIIPFVGAILSSIIGFALAAALIALSVIGIVNAAKGEQKELPIVGQIKIIK